MNESEAYDATCDQFQKDTGIWPPGRDMPDAYCGGSGVEGMRCDAFKYWQSVQRRIDEAYIAGLTEYAWWKDGVQDVGTCGQTLAAAIDLYRNRLVRKGGAK